MVPENLFAPTHQVPSQPHLKSAGLSLPRWSCPVVSHSAGVMFPWCVVFVLSHLLLGLVLIFWDAIKSQTMLPATSM